MFQYFKVDSLWKELEVQPVNMLVLFTYFFVCVPCAAGPTAKGRPRAEAQPQRCAISGESFRDSQWVLTHIFNCLFSWVIRSSFTTFNLLFQYLNHTKTSLNQRSTWDLPLTVPPSSQVNTGAQCNATRNDSASPCWRPNEVTRRRLRPSVPWPLCLWPTLTPWIRGKAFKVADWIVN